VTRAGIPPEDAQFLETRKFTRSEIAGIYLVPPHKIGDLEHATFSNIEHQSLDFVVNTLRPWLVRWEQAISARLIGEVERKSIFAEFNVDGLLRGDIQSRYQAYSVARNWGWLSRNDIRRMENMNMIEGGDDYLTPLNMTTLGAPAPELPAQPPADTQRALRLLVTDACKRIEQRAGDRDEKHRTWVADVIRPLVQAFDNRSADAIEDEVRGLVDVWFYQPYIDAYSLAARVMGE
jgi:hypothetical protein